jgi:hypothetical protein
MGLLHVSISSSRRVIPLPGDKLCAYRFFQNVELFQSRADMNIIRILHKPFAAFVRPPGV